MKLSSEKLGSVLEQIDAEVIPDDHPSLPKLKEVFGDHTFFVDDGGLTIIQPLDQHRQMGGVVRLRVGTMPNRRIWWLTHLKKRMF